MLTVFASTAFIPTGAEVGVAAGSALVGQRLLEAIFGDQAVRALAAKARADLIRRVDELLSGEQARMVALLDDAGVDPWAAGRMRSASDDVQTSFADLPRTAR
jgi:hypothetical protein